MHMHFGSGKKCPFTFPELMEDGAPSHRAKSTKEYIMFNHMKKVHVALQQGKTCKYNYNKIGITEQTVSKEIS